MLLGFAKAAPNVAVRVPTMSVDDAFGDALPGLLPLSLPLLLSGVVVLGPPVLFWSLGLGADCVAFAVGSMGGFSGLHGSPSMECDAMHGARILVVVVVVVVVEVEVVVVVVVVVAVVVVVVEVEVVVGVVVVAVVVVAVVVVAVIVVVVAVVTVEVVVTVVVLTVVVVAVVLHLGSFTPSMCSYASSQQATHFVLAALTPEPAPQYLQSSPDVELPYVVYPTNGLSTHKSQFVSPLAPSLYCPNGQAEQVLSLSLVESADNFCQRGRMIFAVCKPYNNRRWARHQYWDCTCLPHMFCTCCTEAMDYHHNIPLSCMLRCKYYRRTSRNVQHAAALKNNKRQAAQPIRCDCG